MARQKLIDSLWKKAAHRDSLVKADSLAKVHNNLLNQKMLDSTHKAHRECTGYFALNGGMGLPVSNYATTGAAAAGRDFSICAEFPGTISRYCWTFKFDYGENGTNIPQYLHNASENVYPAGLGYSMNFPIPNYSYYSFMFGISRLFPIGNGRLTIDARLLMGFLQGTVPGTSYNVSDSGNMLTVNRYKSSAWAFAFGFGLDARYRIFSGFSVLLNFDYLTSSPTMQLVSTNFSTAPFTAIPASFSSFTQGFVLNNLTLGIGYTIKPRNEK
jgi:hypothetical protein